jgi:hypothetical protein
MFFILRNILVDAAALNNAIRTKVIQLRIINAITKALFLLEGFLRPLV